MKSVALFLFALLSASVLMANPRHHRPGPYRPYVPPTPYYPPARPYYPPAPVGYCPKGVALYSGYDVTIIEIYGNDTARVRYSFGGDTTISLSSLSCSVDYKSGWSINDRGLYSGYDITVVSLYDNGQARIRYSFGGETMVSLSSMAHNVSNWNGWYVNEQARYSGYDVTIVSVYDNGQVRVRYSFGGETLISASSLVKIVWRR